LMGRFIQVANQMKDEGVPVQLINGAMMAASATYGTYISAGNAGYLKESGVDKLVDVYRKHAEYIQRVKAHELGENRTDS
jgi:hypothetical protein